LQSHFEIFGNAVPEISRIPSQIATMHFSRLSLVLAAMSTIAAANPVAVLPEAVEAPEEKREAAQAYSTLWKDEPTKVRHGPAQAYGTLWKDAPAEEAKRAQAYGTLWKDEPTQVRREPAQAYGTLWKC
jgi:hypothetical protein